jgi:hypothetical protein
LNGAFYDIDAQDLLDVWEAMDSGVRTIWKICICIITFIMKLRVICLSEFRYLLTENCALLQVEIHIIDLCNKKMIERKLGM